MYQNQYLNYHLNVKHELQQDILLDIEQIDLETLKTHKYRIR